MTAAIVKKKWNSNVADGTRMAAYVARPARRATIRGCWFFQEAFGVNHHIRSVAERFCVGRFYVAIAPELFSFASAAAGI